MLKGTPVFFGRLSGTIYDFENVGDILPMHSHSELDVHITMVTKGSFTARGVDWEKTLLTGNLIDWQPNQPHEFIALEDDSRIVNIVKGGGAVNNYQTP